MQQVVLTIEDQSLEKAISDFIQREGMNMQDVFMQAIRTFIKQKSEVVQKHDPFQHSVPIHYTTSEDLSTVKPFGQVTDSAKVGKELRERAWRRGSHE